MPGSSLTINAYLTLGNGASNLTSPILLGSTVTPRAPLLPNQAALVNATPQGAIVWPGGNAGDTLNPLGSNGTGILYTSDGQFVHPETNESEFVAWCRSINCTAIFQVPGELNNSAIARDIVAYTVNTTYSGPIWGYETNITKGKGDPLGIERNVTNFPGLDFRPAYWEIGNEPVFWHHWNQPWGATYDTGNVSATVYGQLVESYELAMDQANTTYTAKILAPPGIGSGAPPTPWINAILNDTGGNLAGVAMHNYAAGTGDPNGGINEPGSIAQFEKSFAPKAGLYSSIQTEAAQIRSLCHMYGRNCTLPLFVTEVGPALSHGGYGPFSATFPGALSVADQAIQAMDFSASTLVTTNIFSTVSDSANSWFSLNGSARPSYTVYSQVLNHLGNDAFPVRATNGVVTRGTDQTLNALATIAPNDSDRHDLLVVNTNVSSPSVFSTNFINSSYVLSTSPAFPATFKNGAPVEVWEWSGYNVTVWAQTSQDNHTVLYNTSDPATPVPIPFYYPHGLPPIFSVPPLSLALFETYNAPAYPVQFEESGLSLAPPNLSAPNLTARWFLDVDGTNTSTNATNITLLLPPGNYPTSAVPILTPTPGHVLVPKERYLPVLPSTTVVGNSPTTVIVSYIRQWALNISWNTSRGTVAATNLGSGIGPPPTWWNASQPLTLKFRPQPDFALDVWAGEGGGSFTGYSIEATIAPTSPVGEQAIFEPGNTVTFSETGLPTGTPWNASLRGLNATSTNSSIVFNEINSNLTTNRGWGYEVSNVTVRNVATGNLTTYRVERTLANVTVDNAPVTVPVTFDELFPITLIETGLPMGTEWNATVAGGSAVQASGTSFGDSIALSEANSTVNHAWGLEVPRVFPPGSPGYRPQLTLPNGTLVNGSAASVVLKGSPLTVRVHFILLTPPATRYPITFIETNLIPGTNWSVTVANGTSVASTGWSTSATLLLWEPNSTLNAWGFTASALHYRFNATADSSVVVAGAPAQATVNFQLLFSITFKEQGLPLPYDPPTGWNVSLATGNPGNPANPGNLALAQNGSSTSQTIVLWEPNSTIRSGKNPGYGYLANAGPEYHFERILPLIYIDGSDVTVSIIFDLLTESTFVETGLLPGTPWPLEVKGFTGPEWNNGSWTEKNFFETPGDWGYSIGDATSLNATGVLTKYHVMVMGPQGTEVATHNGSFTVNQSAVTVTISFFPFPYYPVTFTEQGLPSDATWHVTVRNVTEVGNDAHPILFVEQNGSYGFFAGAAGGYNVSSALYFDVSGVPVSVTVVFVPLNKVIWEETGLGPNLTWSVLLNSSQVLAAHVGWTTVREFNGTGFSFTIPVVQAVTGGPAYVPSPRVGTFDLTGVGLIIEVHFILVTYEVTVTVTGLPSGDQYRISLSNVTETTTLLSFSLARPNGTWSFDIVPPTGFYGSPQGGKLNVTGHSVVQTISI
ncbi:MAG: hypothetical protein WB852_01280, partial [Thermoplasmata archaeon]